jgi:multidrug efflux pump subunit AcrB
LTGIESTQYREEDKTIPVTLRSEAAERHDLAKLETLNVYAQLTGRNVPLSQVADLKVIWEPPKILRRDRLKTVTVAADVSGGSTPIAISQDVEAWLKKEQKNWGIGYKYSQGGEIENSGRANASIGAKLPIAGLIIILLLVGQFNSIRKPVIILMTIPLGLIGVILGLILAQSYFGFMTLLGVISLAGIVINNAIVLLDRIKIEIEDHGLAPPRAVIEAAQRRLRPILLTTATTMGGLLPLWFGAGPMWKPLAITIIFGLMFSTVLTLGVVPVLYSIFYRVKYKGVEL